MLTGIVVGLAIEFSALYMTRRGAANGNTRDAQRRS
jgi:hypothetical protein